MSRKCSIRLLGALGVVVFGLFPAAVSAGHPEQVETVGGVDISSDLSALSRLG